ncbi:cytochrome c oxidase subunit II [Sediminibacillus massiliensis]|uniref:cytochrome c oxidase subunit II n=1 Tax=Sediminibacillus massiliensis TaxID=1926277 RepID=UPI0009883866|nr:cytochrome c oxidase subunit II [Sediminibacillus massiliensis]
MKKLWLMFTLLMLSGCGIRTLDPHSGTARDQAFLIYFSFAIMVVVMVIVFALMIRFVWKYRQTAKNKDDLPEEINGNKRLETAWTLIPVVLLTILAIPTVAITYDLSPTTTTDTEGAIHVQVTGERWNWTFEYANGKQADNVVLPVGETVVFHLNSNDVIHSFWIPELGGKQDVIPGKEILFEVTPDEKGSFIGKCAEFCGLDHANMRFDANIVSAEAYQAWLEKE